MGLSTLVDRGAYLLSSDHIALSKMTSDPWPSNFNMDLEQFAIICQNQVDTPYFETFEWLREFKSNTARGEVRELIEYWLKNNHFLFSNGSKNWKPEITGYRVWNWIATFDFYGSSANESFKNTIQKSLFEQFKYLQKTWTSIQDPISKFRALKGMFAYYFITNRKMNFLLKELESLLDELFFEDGGHKSRNSGLQLLFLRDLIDIRSVLSTSTDLDISSVHKKISQIASIIRLFRHGDGSIAGFNGNITDPEHLLIPDHFSVEFVDMCLSLSDVGRRPPLNAEMMGYMRFTTKSGVCLLSTKLSKPLTEEDYSLNLLNFEWSFDRTVIIKRCEIFIENDQNEFYKSAVDPLVQRTTNDEFHFINAEYEDSDLKYHRQMHLENETPVIKTEETMTFKQPGYIAFRFILGPDVEGVPVSKSSKNIFIKVNGPRKKMVTFNFTASGCQDMFYQPANESEPQAIILMAYAEADKAVNIKWQISGAV